jgi:hypothetical protein
MIGAAQHTERENARTPGCTRNAEDEPIGRRTRCREQGARVAFKLRCHRDDAAKPLDELHRLRPPHRRGMEGAPTAAPLSG